MADRTRNPIAITGLRIGRTDLGDGTAVIDDEALTVNLRAYANERRIRIVLSSVDRVRSSDSDVELSTRDGTHLTLICESPTGFRDELLLRCHALPEVTRALRAFGSRRGLRGTRASAPGDQQKFFAPLLEARRTAGGAGSSPAAVVASFDAAKLTDAMGKTVLAFVAERYAEHGPAQRAFEAELTDLTEPLLVSLQALGDAAARAIESIDDLRLWRVWAAQLRMTFEVADRVWLSLDAALDTAVPSKI